MEAAKIWLVAIVATVTYGIAHDLVTTRVSLEYFTIAPTGIFETQSPILLAFGWGVVATWWAGGLRQRAGRAYAPNPGLHRKRHVQHAGQLQREPAGGTDLP